MDWRRVAGIALDVALIALAAVAVTSLAFRVAGIPGPLAVVKSGSMRPTLEPGDVVLLHPRFGGVEPGDIVAIDVCGSLYLHRVVNVTGEGVFTAGDANDEVDQRFCGGAPTPLDRVSAEAVTLFGRPLAIPKVGAVAVAASALAGAIGVKALIALAAGGVGAVVVAGTIASRSEVGETVGWLAWFLILTTAVSILVLVNGRAVPVGILVDNSPGVILGGGVLVGPGESVTVDVVAKNFGPLPGVGVLTLSGAVSDVGELSRAAIHLDPGESENVTLTISVPRDFETPRSMPGRVWAVMLPLGDLFIPSSVWGTLTERLGLLVVAAYAAYASAIALAFAAGARRALAAVEDRGRHAASGGTVPRDLAAELLRELPHRLRGARLSEDERRELREIVRELEASVGAGGWRGGRRVLAIAVFILLAGGLAVGVRAFEYSSAGVPSILTVTSQKYANVAMRPGQWSSLSSGAVYVDLDLVGAGEVSVRSRIFRVFNFDDETQYVTVEPLGRVADIVSEIYVGSTLVWTASSGTVGWAPISPGDWGGVKVRIDATSVSWLGAINGVFGVRFRDPSGDESGYVGILVDGRLVRPRQTVFINEVELNPPGRDPGSGEWVELYNPRPRFLFIRNWRLRALHGTVEEIDIPLAIIPPYGYYVVNVTSQQWLDNVDECVQLIDNRGRLVDFSALLRDRRNDKRTWQRVPDGGDSWVFKVGTPWGGN